MPTHPLEQVIQLLRKAVLGGAAPGISDGQLLECYISAGEEAAMRALVQRHGPMVWGVCRRILANHHDAEDAFQTTFLVLTRNAKSIEPREKVGNWLYGVAKKSARKARATAVKRNMRETPMTDSAESAFQSKESWNELRPILDQELSKLPEKYRLPIVLCDLEGVSIKEATKRLGLLQGTFASRLARGRKLLAGKLSRRGVALSTEALAVLLVENAASAVPPALLSATYKATAAFAAGKGVASGAISLSVAALVKAVMQSTLVTTMKIALTLALCGGIVATGLGRAGKAFSEPEAQAGESHAAAPQTPAMETVANASGSEQKPRVDVNGDPLPAGAIQRIGSNRFRHTGPVTRLQYTMDGKSLASTSLYGDYLNLWDAPTGKLRWKIALDHLGSERELAFSGDGKKLAAMSNSEFVLLAADTGKKLVRHEWPNGNNDLTRCVAIASDLGSFARGCLDSTVRLYDVATGQEKMRIVVADRALAQFPTAVAFSADRKLIYVLANQKPGILVFDTKTGKAAPTLEIWRTLDFPCRLILSPKNNLLAALDRQRVLLWDLKAGKHRQIIDAQTYGGYWSAAFTSDDSLFAINGYETVIFDTATGEEKRRLASPSTYALAFAPDDKTIAGASNDGCITFWDVVMGQRKTASPEPIGVRSIHFTNNDKEIMLLADGVDWWDVTSAKFTRRITREPKWRSPQTISLDGKLLAVPFSKGDLELVDAVTGEHLRTLTGPEVTNRVIPKFSADGTKLFTAGIFDPRVIIWDVATGKVLHELQSHTKYVDVLAVSADGRWLASAAGAGNARGDYDIRLWDVQTGKLVHRLGPFDGPTFSMIFSPDSSRLVSAGGSGRPDYLGQVRLWDVALGKEVRAFNGHRGGGVSCVAMTPDGRMLATGGEDKTLRLWEVANGKERGRIKGHESYVYSVDFSQDGRLLAAASSDAPIYLWNPYAPEKTSSPTAKLTKEHREKLWHQLANPDASLAFKAICELIAHPSEAVPILEGGWKQLPRATAKQLQNWLEDLGSEDFGTRQAAGKELQRVTAQHEDWLREALQRAAALEVRRRLEKIVEQIEPHRWRLSRMLEVLEQIGTPQARQLMQTLAGQKEDERLAREAKAGLERMTNRDSIP